MQYAHGLIGRSPAIGVVAGALALGLAAVADVVGVQDLDPASRSARGDEAPGVVPVPAQGDQPEYRIVHRVFYQPADHWNPGGATVPQQVDILVPADAPPDAPVFFHIGATSNLSATTIVDMYHQYQCGTPIIFVEAEHRGYGQSISDDVDQTTPSYIRVDQALADAHAIVTALKSEFPGPWMAAGYSQGGGVVIDFAATYPDDVAVVLSSSGVLDTPFFYYYYDEHIRRTLGAGTYLRLSWHARKLKPRKVLDDRWIEREFLGAVIKGLMQYPEYRKYRWTLRWLSYLPTDMMLGFLHWVDDRLAHGAARVFAETTGQRTLTREEAVTGGYTWRMWRYQQCTEVATLDGSRDPAGLLFRTREELCEECRELFGEAPFCDADPTWSPGAKLESLPVPLVFVSGGEDPWMGIGLDVDEHPERGRHIHSPEGGHSPDRHDRELAGVVVTEMLKWACPEGR